MNAACSQFVACLVAVAHTATGGRAQPAQPVHSAAQSWVVESTPLADIGGSPTDHRDQLGRAVAAARFDNGQIAVLDAFIPAVRVYSAKGVHLRDLGRSGQGPGEFGEVIAFATVSDTAVVLDRSGDVEWITSDGRHLRSLTTRQSGFLDPRFNARPSAVLYDGSVLLRAEERLYGRVRGEYRQTVGLLRVANRVVSDTIGWFRGDSIRTDAGDNPIPRPYLPDAGLLWSSAGGRVFAVTADATKVIIVTVGGAPIGEFAAEGRRTPVNEADVAAIADEWAARGATANDRRVIREFVEGRPRARVAPFFRSMLAVSAQELWIESWQRDGSSSEWLVYSATGALIARVLVPANLKLQDVGADWVLGVARDDDDVQHVRLHRLRRE